MMSCHLSQQAHATEAQLEARHRRPRPLPCRTADHQQERVVEAVEVGLATQLSSMLGRGQIRDRSGYER